MVQGAGTGAPTHACVDQLYYDVSAIQSEAEALQFPAFGNCFFQPLVFAGGSSGTPGTSQTLQAEAFGLEGLDMSFINPLAGIGLGTENGEAVQRLQVQLSPNLKFAMVNWTLTLNATQNVVTWTWVECCQGVNGDSQSQYEVPLPANPVGCQSAGVVAAWTCIAPLGIQCGNPNFGRGPYTFNSINDLVAALSYNQSPTGGFVYGPAWNTSLECPGGGAL